MSLYDIFPMVGLTRGADIGPGGWLLPAGFVEDFVEAGTDRIGAAGAEKWALGGTNATTTLVAVLLPSVAPSYDGWVRMTTAGAAADESCIMRQGAPVVMSTSTTDPRGWTFRTRFVLGASVAACNFVFGVGAYNNLNCAATQTATSVDFVILNGVVGYQYQTSAATVTFTAITDENGNNITVAASTDHTAQIVWDGKNILTFYMDGKLIKTVRLATFSLANITAHAGVGDTGGAAKSVDVDYLVLLSAPPKAGR